MVVDENLTGIKVKSYAYPDEFIKHGTVEELEKIYKQDVISIYEDITENKNIRKEKI